MVFSVNQRYGQIDHRKTQRPAGKRLADTGLDRRDKLFGNGAANDLVFEKETAATG